MYWRHFDLTAEPFSLTPDPAFLYLSAVHAEAYAALTVGLRERRGLIAMIGEVGTGKTTLVYSLISGLGPDIHTAYISNARLSFDGILRSALRDFDLASDSVHAPDLLEAFNNFLLHCAEDGSTAALVIDEAQNLSQETFEDLRLLTNFETYKHKLLQIVLVGQPELDAKLRDPALRQVADRIAVRCHVNPLTPKETRSYIQHRLAAVGGSSHVFADAALRMLVRRSEGIPRRINILAHNAMLFAFAAGHARVTRDDVATAIHEREGQGLVRAGRHRWLGRGPLLLAGSVVGLAALAFWSFTAVHHMIEFFDGVPTRAAVPQADIRDARAVQPPDSEPNEPASPRAEAAHTLSVATPSPAAVADPEALVSDTREAASVMEQKPTERAANGSVQPTILSPPSIPGTPEDPNPSAESFVSPPPEQHRPEGDTSGREVESQVVAAENRVLQPSGSPDSITNGSVDGRNGVQSKDSPAPDRQAPSVRERAQASNVPASTKGRPRNGASPTNSPDGNETVRGATAPTTARPQRAPVTRGSSVSNLMKNIYGE